MLSSALMAVLIATSPTHQTEPVREVAQVKSTCNAQSLDPKFVHFVEKAPSEKDAPGMRLIAQTSKETPLVTAGDPSSCVMEVMRLDLGR
jgi:hypothetical protein